MCQVFLIADLLWHVVERPHCASALNYQTKLKSRKVGECADKAETSNSFTFEHPKCLPLCGSWQFQVPTKNLGGLQLGGIDYRER